MIKYILKRLLHMIPVLLIISMVIFGITKLAPGDSVGMGLDPVPRPSRWKDKEKRSDSMIRCLSSISNG